MGNFLQYFFEDFGMMARKFWLIFSDLFSFIGYVFNFPGRMDLIEENYATEFSTLDWILMLLANLLLLALIVVIFILLAKVLRRLFRFRVPVKEYEGKLQRIKELQRDLLRANYEKDKLLEMKASEFGMTREQMEKELAGETGDEVPEDYVPDSKRNTIHSPCVDPEASRFFRLTALDNYYKTEYRPPVYDETITLADFCDRFRRFAASRLGLYYDISMMRYFVSALGTARIVILQGISGTGKTSLAYAFGQFVGRPTSLCPVQPAWRERTELYGYYNEFTRKYTETEFLCAVYEANYYREPHVVILDEMNIARVEYYFAEMLSILEMPRKEDWRVNIVSAVWDNDPCLLDNGVVTIPDNVWFVGTINNDDSTFAVADKVYDRAIPIDLDSRADPFTCEPCDPVVISTDHLERLFAEAKEAAPLNEETAAKMEQLNEYLIKNFKLAFGNRIIKQMRDFVPVYIACGGTEMEAIDFMIAKKVLRKFESLSLGFMKDQLTKFDAYLDKLFGRGTMRICKEYVDYLKKNN